MALQQESVYQRIPAEPGFKPLEEDGTNYIMWMTNMRQYLSSKGLASTIIRPPTPAEEEIRMKQREANTTITFGKTAADYDQMQRDTATLAIRLRLKDELALQLYNYENPYDLWDEIKIRFEAMREITFPETWQAWLRLRFMDFDLLDKYKAALFKITAKLDYCKKPVSEADIIYKTLSTMGPEKQGLRESLLAREYKRSRELFIYLAENEKFNNVANAIAKERPAGTTGIPELNYTRDTQQDQNRRRKPWKQQEKGARRSATPGKQDQNNTRKNKSKTSGKCFKCGKKRHFARDCRTPDDVVEKYRSKNNLSPWRGTKKNNDDKNKNKKPRTEKQEEYNYLDQARSEETNAVLAQKHQINQSTMILDSGATITVIKSRRYFTQMQPENYKISSMSGLNLAVRGSGPASFVLPGGTRIYAERALLIPTARRQVLCENDVSNSGYEISTHIFKPGERYKTFTNEHGDEAEKFFYTENGLIEFEITTNEFVALTGEIEDDAKLWHDRLGHPSTRMLKNTLKSAAGDIKLSTRLPESCLACSRGKLILRPAKESREKDLQPFLHRIQVDICGPISPPSGPFRYFMVMVDSTSRWSEINLLSTRNHAFAKMLIQLIRMQVRFPEYSVKDIRVDGAGEFTSKTFYDYCSAQGIKLEVALPEVHFQNGLAESLIRRIQWIARPLLLKSNLPLTAWGHAILHAADLIRYRPSAGNKLSPHQLATGNAPDIKHLRKFGCSVEVPLDPTKRKKIGPQRKQGIYVGNVGNSLIKYLEPKTGDLFRARFLDCHFDEHNFPSMEIEQRLLATVLDINWKSEIADDYPDYRCDGEVARILRLRELARKIPDAFADTPDIVKTPYTQVQYTPAKILPDSNPANVSQIRRKRGRPLGSKNKPTNTRGALQSSGGATQSTGGDATNQPSVEAAPNVAFTGHIWDRRTKRRDEVLMLQTVNAVLDQSDIPKTVPQAKRSVEWPQWRRAMQDEMNSMTERQVFGLPQPKTLDMKPIRSKWVFAKKRDAEGRVTRYKARLVAKGFTQQFGVDYEFTYSPVMDSITFRFLIALAVQEQLSFRLLDIVTAYLYGRMDKELYMELPEGVESINSEQEISAQNMCNSGQPQRANVNLAKREKQDLRTGHKRVTFAPSSDPTNPEVGTLNSRKRKRELHQVVRIQKAIYGLKQSGRLWYQNLTDYLMQQGFKANKYTPCVFVNRRGKQLVLIAIYVDDLNIFGTHEAVEKTVNLMKHKYKVKDYGRTPRCLGIELEHFEDGSVFLHMTSYTNRLLEKFAMSEAHPVSTPLIVRTLKPDQDEYGPRREDEAILPSEYPYITAVMSMSWLSLNARPDIKFSTHLLSRHSAEPTKRHWRGVKHMLRYLNGTRDHGILFERNPQPIKGYADAGYLSAPEKGRSQSGYVFTMAGSAISWSSKLQPTVATSSNHAELIALFDTTKEAVWLRNMSKSLKQLANLDIDEKPMQIYEDNDACRHQMSEGFIKSENTKHLTPKIFYAAEQTENGNIAIEKITSAENLADLFTKTLPPPAHWKHMKSLKMRSLAQVRREKKTCRD